MNLAPTQAPQPIKFRRFSLIIHSSVGILMKEGFAEPAAFHSFQYVCAGCAGSMLEPFRYCAEVRVFGAVGREWWLWSSCSASLGPGPRSVARCRQRCAGANAGSGVLR